MKSAQNAIEIVVIGASKIAFGIERLRVSGTAPALMVEYHKSVNRST